MTIRLCSVAAPTHLRIGIIFKSGRQTLAVITAEQVAGALKRYAKRGVECYVNQYDDGGNRGRCVGSTGKRPSGRGWFWWCDGDLPEANLQLEQR